MPDWSYQTLLRPLLERVRGIVLGTLRSPGARVIGPALIEFLGHVRPSPQLSLVCNSDPL